MKDDQVSVWVGCLASYNNGELFGCWLTYGEEWGDRDDLGEQILKMLEASPSPGAEEWEIFDTNNLPKFLREDPDLDAIVQFAEGHDDHGEEFLVWAGESESVNGEEFEESYYGWVENVRVFGEEFADSGGMLENVSDQSAGYIDYEKFGNDLLASDYYSVRYKHGLLIFRHV